MASKQATAVYDRILQHAKTWLYNCLVHPHPNRRVAAFQLEGAYQQLSALLEEDEPYGFVLDGVFHDMAEDEIEEVEEDALEALGLKNNKQ